MSIAIRYYELWCYRELVVKLVALLNPAITSQTKFQTNQYSYDTLQIDLSMHVFCSSVGQSERLLTVRSEVRALPGERAFLAFLEKILSTDKNLSLPLHGLEP